MSYKQVLYDAFGPSESGSTFVLYYDGEICFGGDDGYDGWYDTLPIKKTFEIYESLKVLFDGQ